MGGSRGMFTLVAKRIPRCDCPRATMQGTSSVCGQAARSPLIPDPPSREARELLGGVAAERDFSRRGACPNLAYPERRLDLRPEMSSLKPQLSVLGELGANRLVFLWAAFNLS